MSLVAGAFLDAGGLPVLEEPRSDLGGSELGEVKAMTSMATQYQD